MSDDPDFRSSLVIPTTVAAMAILAILLVFLIIRRLFRPQDGETPPGGKRLVEYLTSTVSFIAHPVIALSFPIWGTVLATYVSCTFRESAGNAILTAGLVLAVFSAAPIVSSDTLHWFAKLLLLPIYFFIGALVIFFLGWASICWFCPHC